MLRDSFQRLVASASRSHFIAGGFKLGARKRKIWGSSSTTRICSLLKGAPSRQSEMAPPREAKLSGGYHARRRWDLLLRSSHP